MEDTSGAAAPLAFSRFLEIMNSDQAKDLVRRINTFMKDLRQRPPAADADSEAVQAFLEEMETAMAKHPLFAGSGPAELDGATEALEKYLMTKLHDRTFGVPGEDAERDALLSVRCDALQFVGPEHLEIAPGVVVDEALAQAAAELNRMNNYKAPRDKLVCILNCCRVIGNMLHTGPAADGGVAGADDFTPLLILSVIRARPPRLGSNIAYVERYRMRSKMGGEAAYYSVQLCSAATFIEMVDASSLHGVSADEFLAHMLQSGALSEEQLRLMGAGSGDGGVPASQQQAQQQAAPPQQQAAMQMNALPAAAGGFGYPPPTVIQPLPPHHHHHQQQQQQQQQAWGPAPYASQPPPPAPAAAPPPPPVAFPPLLSLAELEEQGGRLLAAAGGGARLAQRHPFAFAPLESLTVGDVGKLLTAYKELVLRFESLSAALDWHQQQAAAGCAALARQQQQAAAAAAAAAPPPPPPAPAAAPAAAVGLSPLASPRGAAPAAPAVAAPPMAQQPQPPAARAAAAPAAASAAVAGASSAAPPLAVAPAPLPDDVLAQLMGDPDYAPVAVEDAAAGGSSGGGGDSAASPEPVPVTEGGAPVAGAAEAAAEAAADPFAAFEGAAAPLAAEAPPAGSGEAARPSASSGVSLLDM